jgi:hypothetical protein
MGVKKINGSTPSICNEEKTCNGCGVLKQIGAFYKRTLPTGNISYRSKCKLCEKVVVKISERKKAQAESAARWRKVNTEKYKEVKRKFYASEKGKECKRREDKSYKTTGGRKLCEIRRSEKPMSEARKLAKNANNSQRREKHNNLVISMDEFSLFGLKEAHSLRKLRNKLTNILWNVDHIHPIAKGGNSRYENIQVVPEKWNKQKSHLHSDRYFGVHTRRING